MARELKSAPAKPVVQGNKPAKRAGMPPMLTGIIIGLLLGIMLALAVAVWLNRAHTPFVDKSPPVESLPAFAARPAPATKDEKGEVEKPRFEFYQILPGEKGGGGERAAASPSIAKPAPAVEVRQTTKTEAAGLRDAPKPSVGETVFLQAGAFQSESDAENLKAKIAFSGFEASIRPVNLRDKGTLYRVRLGPYKSADEVNRIKTALSQNGIGAAVVKAGD
jgi:cell division protein FtsN